MLDEPEIPDPSEAVEPWAIMNPYGKFYKFLFREKYEDDMIRRALDFVVGWAGEHGWVINKQKQKNFPSAGHFELTVWLK